MTQDTEIAEAIGEFRDMLVRIAVGGAGAGNDSRFRELREGLIQDSRVKELLPDFVIERRSPRDFWNYIQRIFSSYAERTRYIEAQLLPVERQFRPDRDRIPGTRPPEVRIEYSTVRPAPSTGMTFVSEQRLAELRTAQSTQFDLRKVVRLCEELNVTYAEGCFLATIGLIRTLLDHVPPIFKLRTFAEVANNHGGRSFKEAMQRLENSARKIADGHLHMQIRLRETLPAAQQVNFSAEIDALLAEIVRIL